MPLVTARPIAEYPWYARLFFWKQRQTYGRVLDPGLLWGRSPKVFAAVALLYGALDRRSSPLSPALRSLVTVRVSQINHCAFCVDINSATLAKRGVSMEKIDALGTWRDSQLFGPDERLALEYAEAMTVPQPGVWRRPATQAKKALERRHDRRADRPYCFSELVVEIQCGARRAVAGVLHSAEGAVQSGA